MKKIVWLSLCAFLFLLTGCGKYDEKDIMKDLNARLENIKGYYLEGEMEIINNEDVYKYDVKVAYQKNELFKVNLKNKANNHEQILLRNNDGVYVLTPSLNKSFKFQSEWPYNNSQCYILQTLLKDIKNDNEKTFEETENYYVITTKVNYPNNRKLEKQVIYFDKQLEIKEVQVINDTGNTAIKMKFTKTDMKATYSEKHFTLNENMNTAVLDEVIEPVMKIEDIIYPMYIPEATSLSAQNKVNKTEGERIILTFEGEKPFILVEETATKEDELITIPTYGEPSMIIDTVGVISDNSVSWISNGLEYYIASDDMEIDELVTIATSIGTIPVGK
ncbi:MAG TPA: outer membrane lipoprotein carrier protein LolA [Mollicutes bacterium]|nr:outer membrane lipoprotein carrier protein LolA [Mollicutes bacterium]